MKKIQKISLTIIIVFIFILFTCLWTTRITPIHISTRRETIENSTIPESLNNVQILFFSDVHYNKYVNNKRLHDLISKINELNPDIVIFGGDLFDHPSNNIPNEEAINFIQTELKSIKAPLGKFYVYGNHDLESPSTKDIITNIFYNADFESVNNKALKISNKKSGSINLVGFESILLGEPDIITPLSNISADSYTIAVCHTPDIIDELDQNKIDYMLSGHSHGGQIRIPIYGSLYKPVGAIKYNRGKYTVNNTIIDITNGTGTTRYDIRFLADAEIVLYTLKNKKVSE